MIRGRLARLRRRPRVTGELGRLLDAWPGPGATLTFSADGDWCAWLEGSCCAPIHPDGPTPRFDAAALTADAAAAGLVGGQLAEALARIDDLTWRRVLARAAGRELTGADPSPAELARVAARQVWPSLLVRRSLPRHWWWEVTAPDGRTLAPTGAYDPATSELPTQQAALEVGLAHLAVISAAWAVDQLGAELPPGVERIAPAA